MDLRDGMATMSLTGELAGTPLPGVDPARVEYVHLLPNLLVSAHPDYVMAHRMVPLAPDRTWVECSWFVVPGSDGSAPKVRGAVEFWDITNKQDWAACESVQRGLGSPHFSPGPFAPKEDAVADLVATISRAYERRAVRAVRPGPAGVLSAVVVLACALAGLSVTTPAEAASAKPKAGPRQARSRSGR